MEGDLLGKKEGITEFVKEEKVLSEILSRKKKVLSDFVRGERSIIRDFVREEKCNIREFVRVKKKVYEKVQYANSLLNVAYL